MRDNQKVQWFLIPTTEHEQDILNRNPSDYSLNKHHTSSISSHTTLLPLIPRFASPLCHVSYPSVLRVLPLFAMCPTPLCIVHRVPIPTNHLQFFQNAPWVWGFCAVRKDRWAPVIHNKKENRLECGLKEFIERTERVWGKWDRELDHGKTDFFWKEEIVYI